MTTRGSTLIERSQKAPHFFGCQHTLCPLTVAFRGRLAAVQRRSDPSSRAHFRCVPPAPAFSHGGGSLDGLAQVLLPFNAFHM